MKKLSNTEAELTKSVAYKKKRVSGCGFETRCSHLYTYIHLFCGLGYLQKHNPNKYIRIAKYSL